MYTLERFSLICLSCFLGSLMGCGPSKPLPKPTGPAPAGEQTLRFVDVTQAKKIDHQYRNGEESDQFTYLESFGGGLAVFDFDRDGWNDLYFTGGGSIEVSHAITPLPGSLWRNRFGANFENTTDPSQSGKTAYYSSGVIAGDINSDGFPDLLITGYRGLQLLVNLGDGTFQEVAEKSGVMSDQWSTSAGFGDLDKDGCLDIYIAHNADWSWEKHPDCNAKTGQRDICPPPLFDGLPDLIFMSNQDGTFRKVSSEVGLDPDGKGLAVILADLNQDSALDIYVANDATYNFLYINQGDGKFSERGLSSGAGLDERGNPNGSMGIAIFDIDGNLAPDLWVTNYENETCALYKNEGEANFRCVSSTTGIMAIGTLFVGFGTVAADMDLDGDEDLAIANGHVIRHPVNHSREQSPLLLRNSGTGKLVRQSFEPDNYFSKKWRGRGVVAFDFDEDGDLDLAFSHMNQNSKLLENESTRQGNWVRLELVGTKSNRDAIGARLIFRTDKKRYLRNIVGGGSYQSQNPYSVHLGIPSSEKIEDVEITWPNGQVQIVPASQNTVLRIVQP